MRKAVVKRKTKETEVEVAVDLDGTGASSIATGIGFFDHMLDLLARHSRIDLTVKAKGDLHIDHHHTTEDVGIALGQAVKQALGDMKGITRYASVHMPMDEALTRVAIDISGRPFLVFKAEFSRAKVGTFDTNAALVDAIEAGDVQWAVDQQPFLQGYLSVDSLWLYLNNGNVIGGGKPVFTGPAFIDKSNIDAVAEYAKGGTR